MTKSYETSIADTGETLWPVETMMGLRYMRGVDADVLTAQESNPNIRREIAEKMFEDLTSETDDSSDPIGNLAG